MHGHSPGADAQHETCARRLPGKPLGGDRSLFRRLNHGITMPVDIAGVQPPNGVASVWAGALTMGIYAAKSAVLLAAQLHLSNNAQRLLVYMALECWDDANNPGRQLPRRYFGRREASAIALGYAAPRNGSDPAFTAVKRAVRELTGCAVIQRVRTGGNGRPAEFELMLDSARPGQPWREEGRLVLLPSLDRQEGSR